MLDFYDCLYVVCTSILKTMIIFFGGFILYNLIMYNHGLGVSIADAMGIPHDLALTFSSLGFANNIMVIFTVLDLILIGIAINELNKNETMNKLFTDFTDFMKIY